MGQEKSQKHRERISRGVKRSWELRRARRAFLEPHGSPVRLGGKTGTGDNRHKIFDRAGRMVESRVTSRTASFAFVIGDRFFGVITALVIGKKASEYEFTSSLPVHVLKILAPDLDPVVASPISSQPERATPRPQGDLLADPFRLSEMMRSGLPGSSRRTGSSG